MIIRGKRTTNYTVIPNELLNSDALTFRDKGLLCYLLSKPENWRVSISNCARVGEDGKHAINEALKRMREAGYVRMVRHQSGKVDWYVYDMPYPENQDGGQKPHPENPDRGFPDQENQDGLISKESYKVKSLQSNGKTPLARYRAEAVEVLEFLNKKTGKHYRAVDSNVRLVASILAERQGDTTTLYQVIAKKRREWGADEKMRNYLRPKTLFNKTNFAQYEGELGAT